MFNEWFKLASSKLLEQSFIVIVIISSAYIIVNTNNNVNERLILNNAQRINSLVDNVADCQKMYKEVKEDLDNLQIKYETLLKNFYYDNRLNH